MGMKKKELKNKIKELEKDESGNQPSWGSFIYGCIHSRRMDLLPSRHGNNIFKLWLET